MLHYSLLEVFHTHSVEIRNNTDGKWNGYHVGIWSSQKWLVDQYVVMCFLLKGANQDSGLIVYTATDNRNNKYISYIYIQYINIYVSHIIAYHCILQRKKHARLELPLDPTSKFERRIQLWTVSRKAHWLSRGRFFPQVLKARKKSPGSVPGCHRGGISTFPSFRHVVVMYEPRILIPLKVSYRSPLDRLHFVVISYKPSHSKEGKLWRWILFVTILVTYNSPVEDLKNMSTPCFRVSFSPEPKNPCYGIFTNIYH